MVDLLDTVNESIDRLQNAVRGAAAAGFDGGLVNAWVNSFEAHRIDRFEARVGFIGRTGEGKSQAINAILGQRNVFPTSGFNACTATVIEASYQAEKDYKAEIEFITREQWDRNLEEWTSTLFPRRRAEEDGDDANVQNNVVAMRTSVTDILQSLLGRRVTPRNIATRSRLRILFQEATGNVRHLLSRTDHPHTEEVQCTTIEEFTETVRPYIANPFGITDDDGMEQEEEEEEEDCGAVGENGDQRVRGYWPLVAICRMYHNWEVLRGGLVLVDLPGTRDANAVRGQIANRYLEMCNALFVVADCARALDDGDAWQLSFTLDQELERQLQLDGRLNTVSFLLTKTDIYNGEGLARVVGRRQEWQEAQEAWTNAKSEQTAVIDAGEFDRFYAVRDRAEFCRRELQNIEMECLQSINEVRRRRVQELHQAHVRELRQGREGELPAVDVFCISSLEALQLNRFPEQEYTEVPRIRNHLKRFANDQRIRLARRSLRLSYERTTIVAEVLTGRTLEGDNVEQDLNDVVVVLNNKILDVLRTEITERFRGHQLTTVLQAGAEDARQNAVPNQAKWRKFIAWNTYLATVSRNGVFESSGGVGYVNMNRRLASPILDAIRADWEALFENFQEISPETSDGNREGRLLTSICNMLEDWVGNENGAERRRNLLPRVLLCIETKFPSWARLIQEFQAESWRSIETVIQRALLNGYAHASRERGSGMFDRMNGIMIGEVERQIAMFDDAIKNLRTGMSTLAHRIAGQADSDLLEMREQIRREFEVDFHAIDHQRCARLVEGLNVEANRILELGRDVDLQLNPESEERLMSAVRSMRPYLNSEELGNMMERIQIADS